VKQFANYLRKKNFILSVALCFGLYLLFYITWTLSYYSFFQSFDICFMPTPNDTVMKQPLYEQLIKAVVLGPLIETLLFQKCAYQLFSLVNWLKHRKGLIIIFAGIVFGLLHFYSFSYIVYNIFIGFFLMSVYIVKLGKNPFWIVSVLHGLLNLFAIFIDPLEKSIMQDIFMLLQK